MTRKKREGSTSQNISYKADDDTLIKDFHTFLSKIDTKESLTMSLAKKVVDKCKALNIDYQNRPYFLVGCTKIDHIQK